jgi:SlyX protein
MMNPDLIHDRITELETRLEFQDDTITRLNDALVVQQQRYFELERKLMVLIKRLQSDDTEMADPAEEPPPPHY